MRTSCAKTDQYRRRTTERRPAGPRGRAIAFAALLIPALAAANPVAGSDDPSAILRAIGCPGKADAVPHHPDPVTLDEVFATYRAIGQAAGCETGAWEHVLAVSRELAALSSSVLTRARPRVALLVGLRPAQAPRGDSFVTDLIEIAGGETVLEDVVDVTRTLSPGELVGRAPEVVILATADGAGPAHAALAAWLRDAGIDARAAVLRPAAIRDWSDLPGGARAIQRILFPDMHTETDAGNAD